MTHDSRWDEAAEHEQAMLDDPQPRRGFNPGDKVSISVDPYGLWGREPHPPVGRRIGRGLCESPCKEGYVAYYDAEIAKVERENWSPPYPPEDFYYVATNAGFYVFASYELTLVQPAATVED